MESTSRSTIAPREYNKILIHNQDKPLETQGLRRKLFNRQQLCRWRTSPNIPQGDTIHSANETYWPYLPEQA